MQELEHLLVSPYLRTGIRAFADGAAKQCGSETDGIYSDVRRRQRTARRSPDVIVEERGSAVVECQEAVSSAPSPSTISHSTTTSEGSEHDITQLQSAAAMAPLRTAAPLMVDFSPPPAAKRVIRPTAPVRPQEYRLSRFPTPASLPASSTPVAPMPPAAPIVRARKRPLIDAPGSEKITFPGYGERSNIAAAAPASTSSSSTATVFAMVAKQLKKIKRSHM